MVSDDFEARQRAARERVEAFEKAQKEKAAQKEAEAYQTRLDQLAQKREETLKEVEAMHDSTSNLSIDPNDLLLAAQATATAPTKITPARQKSKTQEQRLKEQNELKERLEKEEADRRAKLDAVRQQQANARKNRLEREKNRERLREQQRLENQRLADQQIRASQANMEELARIAKEQQDRLNAFGVHAKTKKEQQQEEAARKAREQEEKLERLRRKNNSSMPMRSLSGPRRTSAYIELKPVLHWEDIAEEVAQNQSQDLSVLSQDQQRAMKEYQDRLAAAMEEIPQEDVEEFQKFNSRRGSTHVNVHKSKRSSVANDWNLEDFDVNDYTTPKERKAALKAYKKQLAKRGIEHDNLEDLDDVAAFQKMMDLQKQERAGVGSMIDTSRTRHDNDELDWKLDLDLDDFDLSGFGTGAGKKAAHKKQKQQLHDEDDALELDVNDFEDAAEFHKLIRAQNRKQRGSATDIDTSRTSHSNEEDWNIDLDSFDPSAFTNAREREAALQAYKTQLAMQQSFQLDLDDLPGVQDFQTLGPSIQPGKGKKPDINWEDEEMVKVVKEMSDSGQSLDLLSSIGMDQSELSIPMEEDESNRSSMNGSSKRRSGAGTKRINRRTLRRQRSSSLGAMDRSKGLRRVKTMEAQPNGGAQSRPSYNWTAPDFNWSNFKEAGTNVAEEKKNKKKDAPFKRGNTVALSPTREKNKDKSPSRSSRRASTMSTTPPPSRGVTRQRSSSLTDMTRGKDRSSTKKEKDKSPSRSSRGRRATTVATSAAPTKRGVTRQRSSSLTDMKRERRGTTKSPVPTSKDKKKDKKSKSPAPTNPKRGITRQLSSSLSDLKFDWKEEASKRSMRRSSTMDKETSTDMKDKSSKRGSMRRSSTMDKDSSMKDASKSKRGVRRSSTMDKDTSMKDASMKDASTRGSRRSVRRSSTMDKDASMKDTSSRGSRRGGRRSSTNDTDDKSKDKENKNESSKHDKSSSKSGTEESPDTFYNWISHSKDAISRLESKKAALEERRKKKKQQRKDRRTEQTLQQMSQEYENKMAQLKSTLESAHAQQLESIKMELSGQLNELKGTLAEQQKQREEDEARRIEKERQEEEARRARQLEEDMAISVSSIGIGSMGDTVLSDDSNGSAADTGKAEDTQEKDGAPKEDKASEEEDNNSTTGSAPNMDGYVNVMGCFVRADNLDAAGAGRAMDSEPPADNTPPEDAAVSEKTDNEEAAPDSPEDATVAETEALEAPAAAATATTVEQKADEKGEDDTAQPSKEDASADNEIATKDAKTAVTDAVVTPDEEAKKADSAEPKPDDAMINPGPPSAAKAKTPPRNKKQPVATKPQGADAAKRAQPAAGKKPAATPASKTTPPNKNAKPNAGAPPSNTGKKEAVTPTGRKTPPANNKKPPASKAVPAANKKPAAGPDKNLKAKKASDPSPMATSSVGTDATEESTLDGSTGSKEGPVATKATAAKGKKASDEAPSVTKQGSKTSKAAAAPVASKRTSLAKGTNEAEIAKKKTVLGPTKVKATPPKTNQGPKTVEDPSPTTATPKAAKDPSPPRVVMDDASERSAASKGKRGSFFGKAVKGMKGIMGRRGSLLGSSKNTSEDMDESKKESTEISAAADDTKQQPKVAPKKTPAKPTGAKGAVTNKAKQAMQALGNKTATKGEAAKKNVKAAASSATKSAVKAKTANNAGKQTAGAKVLPERELSDIVRDKIREGLEPKTRSPKKAAYKPPKPAKLEPDQDDYQDSPLRTLDTYEDELTIEQLRAKVAKLEQQLKKAEEAEAKEVEEVVQAGRDMYQKLSKKAENVSNLPDDMSELDSVKEKNDEIVKYLKEENERRRNENSQIEKAVFELHQETVFLEKQTEQTLGYLEKLEDVYYQGELDKRQKLLNTLTTFRDGDERLSDELQRRENWAEAEKRVHKTYDQYMAKLLIKCDKSSEDKGLVGLLCAISMGRHDNALVEAATGKQVFANPDEETKVESPSDQPQKSTIPTEEPAAEPPQVEKVSSGSTAKAMVTQ